MELWYKSYRTCSDINVERCASQNVIPTLDKKWYDSQTNTNFALKNISVEPKISHLLIPIELEFSRKVWICMSAKINVATIEFWYKSYRTINDINVERCASQNVIPPHEKKWYGSQTITNFALKNISVEP